MQMKVCTSGQSMNQELSAHLGKFEGRGKAPRLRQIASRAIEMPNHEQILLKRVCTDLPQKRTANLTNVRIDDTGRLAKAICEISETYELPKSRVFEVLCAIGWDSLAAEAPAVISPLDSASLPTESTPHLQAATPQAAKQKPVAEQIKVTAVAAEDHTGLQDLKDSESERLLAETFLDAFK